jgi:DNA-binding NtrC family response regulator
MQVRAERDEFPRRSPGTAPASDDDGDSTDGFRSSSFLAALHQLERFARDDTATILIEGASGTGKTRLARRVHRLSPRNRGPFCQITLSAIDDGLASSELFGHVAGAFTDARTTRAGLFVSAAGGTLFLDEIGKSSRAVQHRLLHVIEYGELRPVGSDRDIRVDVRLVVAANEPLGALSDTGIFLPDLFARLSVFCVRLPTLSERRADIPILVERYLRAHARRLGVPKPTVAPELMHAFQRAPWPNNLRQLDATIHRLLIESEGESVLTPALCVGSLSSLRPAGLRHQGSVSKSAVEAAVAKAGTVSGAAELLGVHRTTLYRAKHRENDG